MTTTAHIDRSIRITNEPGPGGWNTVQDSLFAYDPKVAKLLSMARRAFLKRIGGSHQEAARIEQQVHAGGADANAVSARNSNKLNLSEVCQKTAGLCMDLKSAQRDLTDDGGNAFDANLRVQLLLRDVNKAALQARSKFTVVSQIEAD